MHRDEQPPLHVDAITDGECKFHDFCRSYSAPDLSAWLSANS